MDKNNSNEYLIGEAMATIIYGLKEEKKRRTNSSKYYNLLPQVYDQENLEEAWLRVLENEGCAGIDRVTIRKYGEALKKNLEELERELKEGNYRPQAVKRVFIPKPSGKKRPLGIPTVKDRVAQTAVYLVLAPIFEVGFLNSSYGYRPNKDAQKAIRKVDYYRRQGCNWAVIADIDSYFDTVKHEKLMDMVEEKIGDEDILSLIERWLKAGVVYENEYQETVEGVAQGGAISPLLANIYLHPFDMRMEELGYNLVRYADDFVVLCESRKEVEEALAEVRRVIEDELDLKIKSSKTQFTSFEKGFDFLGFHLEGSKRYISQEKIEHFGGRVKEIVKTYKSPKIMLEELNELIEGWRNYYRMGDVEVERQLAEVDRKVRAYLEGVFMERMGGGRQIITGLKSLRYVSDRKKKMLKIFKGSEGNQSYPKYKPYNNLKKWKSNKDKNQSSNEQNISDNKSDNQSFQKDESQVNEISSNPEPKLEKSSQDNKPKENSKPKEIFTSYYSESGDLMVFNAGAFVGKESERIVVKEKKRKIFEAPFFQVKQIVISSKGIAISSDLVRECAKEGIPINFLSTDGDLRARMVSSSMLGTAVIRQEQLKAKEDRRGVELAKAFVRGKIRNQINLLKYYAKYRKKLNPELHEALRNSAIVMRSIEKELDELEGDRVEDIRGKLFAIEGRVAHWYWQAVKWLVMDKIEFEGRKKRGAKDLFNVLLNYGYGILYSKVWNAVDMAGLDPYVGYIHVERAGQPSLVLDLVEEFRQQAVDRAVIGMINKGAEFKQNRSGQLSKRAKKRLAKAMMKRLAGVVKLEGRRYRLGGALRKQAQKIASYVRGGEDYMPFVASW